MIPPYIFSFYITAAMGQSNKWRNTLPEALKVQVI